MLPNCTFRVSKPAIVGVRVLAGRIRPGTKLITSSGGDAGRIRSIHSGEDSLKEASQGEEVAIGLDGVTAGRQINEGDELYVDLLESSIAQFSEMDLTGDEKDTMDETLAIKRKEDLFWGM